MARTRLIKAVALSACIAAAACSNTGRELRTPPATRPPAVAARQSAAEFSLSGPNFEADGSFDKRYATLDTPPSPALEWAGAPAAATRLALVADLVETRQDGSLQSLGLVWLVLNITANSRSVAEGAVPPDGHVITPWLYQSQFDAGIRFRLFALNKRTAIEAIQPEDYVAALEAENAGVAEIVVPMPKEEQ